MTITVDMMLYPDKYGLCECSHCRGYGSSLLDPEGVNTCTCCGGSGLVKKCQPQPEPETEES